MIQRQARRIASSILLGGLALVLLENLVRSPGQFVSVLLLGITLGSIYALVALGYTLVYGIIELINFAHGDVFMWGTMVTVTLSAHWIGLDGSQAWYVTVPLVAGTLLAAMAFCGTMNVTIERFAYRPLRNAPKLAPLITAIGMSFILQNLALAIYGPREQSANNIKKKN
jgi:branched-chain amino acid transport system permease protein